ncbi:RNA-binding protein [Sporosarcina sp. P26b]|uniref:YlmH family RNA-binding protein n=1 Tax=Sporosarcina TaxID=1569 RepID=UPI000A17B142|nr:MULTISPECIES: YlmH/Sll1252 family protein [Sporosarcina]ARK22649.1 RNA-binding protein [Sporosarcina ureae]PIC75142.1 RNA-binding protein [Sporosarcina sp. P17b]PIC97105.1 RNA-binding protein [Sporosarcina sp. P26b]
MDSIFQHFRKDEQPFIEKVNSWVKEVEDTYAPKLTEFLDPRQRFITESIVRNSDLTLTADGGFLDAERQRVLIYPDYYMPTKDDFQISIYQVNYPQKFVTMKHSQLLGSLMSIGIERSRFGDIQLTEEAVQFAVAQEVSEYIHVNFTQVGKVKVSVEPVLNAEDFIDIKEEWTEDLYIISSLRLDTVVAALTNSSRAKASSLIKGEKVKVNWAMIDQQAFEIEEYDVLSIRGYGRFRIMSIEGRTKKDKIRVMIGSLV